MNVSKKQIEKIKKSKHKTSLWVSIIFCFWSPSKILCMVPFFVHLLNLM